MDVNKIIRYTNKVALLSIALLVYWVFIFVSITVFGFKIFRENITQVFYMSILGIFAILGGAIVVNIMLNLTKISEHLEKKVDSSHERSHTSKLRVWLVISSFPLIFTLLYLGDLSSTLKKRSMLLSSGESLIKERKKMIENMANYKFGHRYAEKVSNSLKLLSKVDESFPQASLIIRDRIKNKSVLLIFTQHYYSSDHKHIKKVDFIFPTSTEERAYLNSVFDRENTDFKFSASDGQYELYYPIQVKDRIIVLYLSDRKRYGKIGS